MRSGPTYGMSVRRCVGGLGWAGLSSTLLLTTGLDVCWQMSTSVVCLHMSCQLVLRWLSRARIRLGLCFPCHVCTATYEITIGTSLTWSPKAFLASHFGSRPYRTKFPQLLTHLAPCGAGGLLSIPGGSRLAVLSCTLLPCDVSLRPRDVFPAVVRERP